MTTAILTTDEKVYLDNLPTPLIKAILEHPDEPEMKMNKVTEDGVTTYEFKGERADAVREYYLMLIGHGVMADPRD